MPLREGQRLAAPFLAEIATGLQRGQPGTTAFCIPALRHRGWTADYTTKGKGYRIWSTYGDEEGFRVWMVFRSKGRAYLLDHINPDWAAL